MKCSKCNSEMRIGTEQVGVDKNNLPIFHRYAYCDCCKIKRDLDLVLKKNGNSALSVLSIVFAGVPMIITLPYIIAIPMIFVGFILALIDIGIGDKQKKHIGSYFGIVFAVLTFIVLGGFL